VANCRGPALFPPHPKANKDLLRGKKIKQEIKTQRKMLAGERKKNTNSAAAAAAIE
jgi:hypothetical protein